MLFSDHPIPVFPKPVPLGYEVDPGLAEHYHAFMLRDPYLVKIFLRARFQTELFFLKPEFPNIEDSCWLLRNRENPATLRDLKKARHVIAEEMGLLPAAYYEFLDLHYDPDFVARHKADFYYHCKFVRRLCLRPSHLLLCTRDGRRVPTLTYSPTSPPPPT